MSTSCYHFIFIYLCATSHSLPLSVADSSRHCYRSPPLKYRFRYVRSRHFRRFRYLASDTMCGTLLCQPLPREIWSWSHRSRRFRSNKWDDVNVFPPNTSAIFLLRLYRHHTPHHASLLPSSSAALISIRVFFVVPIVLPLCRISAHIRRVSAHFHLPRLFSPHDTVSFVPVIYSLTITHTFRFSGVGIPSPIS